MSGLIEELKRRKVFWVGIAYGVVGWLVIRKLLVIAASARTGKPPVKLQSKTTRVIKQRPNRSLAGECSTQQAFTGVGSHMKRVLYILATFICLVTGLPRPVLAETHQVAVLDNVFSPNDLVIHAGDTVQWVKTYQEPPCDPYFGCQSASEHTVTADDLSWSSGPPADEFSYSTDFNEAGEVLYHCEVHSIPGRDINSFMNGRITVLGAEQLIQINAGLNDAWFNPATAGQGFFIIVFPVIKAMFVAMFTFETELPDPSTMATLGWAGQRWFTAFGDYADNQAVLDIEITSGGVFDSPEPVVSQVPDGTLTVEFEDCSTGMITYNIPSIGRQGVIPIQRLANDNIALCEAFNAQ